MHNITSNKIKCSQCDTLDITQKTHYFDREGTFVGEWPLYFIGAKPTEPFNATHYFCGATCSNNYHRMIRDGESKEEN